MQFPHNFFANGVHSGIKKSSKLDLALFYSKLPCRVLAGFTKNKLPSASVIISKKNINNPIHSLVINSGNANSATGERGIRDCLEICRCVGKNLNISPKMILIASTGIIGKYLPISKIKSSIPELCYKTIHNSNPLNSAKAILTTDTKHKVVYTSFNIKNEKITVWGCAKGAGMIHPQLKSATLLVVVLTDAGIIKPMLKIFFDELIDKTFNRISIDGETSTNDSVFLLANGSCGLISGKSLSKFKNAVEDVFVSLSGQIVEDGEGGSKIIQIEVVNSPTENIAHKIAEKIAVSPLVKTAIYGGEANWGRIYSSIGSALIDIDYKKLKIFLDDRVVYYKKPKSSPKNLLKNKKIINVKVDLSSGRYKSKYLTCDLTERYVKINSGYST